MINPENNRIANYAAAFFIGRSMKGIELKTDNLETIKEQAQILCDTIFKEISTEHKLPAKYLQNLFRVWLLTKRKISGY